MWKIYTGDNYAKMSSIIVCSKLFIAGCVSSMVSVDTDTGIKNYVCHTLSANFTNLGYSNGQLFFTSDDGYMYVVGQCDPVLLFMHLRFQSINGHIERPYTFPPATFTPTIVFTAYFNIDLSRRSRHQP